MIYPSPLKEGDKIAIVSPASIINPDYVEGAVATLQAEGWLPVVGIHALGNNGSYSGTIDERVDDLEAAFSDSSVRAILCSRGGYGVVHLLERLSSLSISDPKWVVGFSDISALHAMMVSKGIVSVHASMAKQVALGVEDSLNRRLFDILRGYRPKYFFAPSEFNRCGTATGTILGGNLAVLAQLINTPYDILRAGSILFIEDVAEPIYKIERILYQLRLSGVLSRLSGLIVGRFTDYTPSRDYESMERMIADMVAPYSYPVAFDVPIGHIDENIPVIEGSDVTLRVAWDGVELLTL